ncbi:MAG: TetR/AcrR family transcriptional regulator [Myxococcota bacterium]|nr:TetR/AcrR family transcriptional regulator [Myxococcota bacterium]
MAAPRRGPGRPAAADSAETRARILDAARQRFAASGYGRARIQGIAEHAGVTTTAVYHYFDSKAELYGAVYAAGVDVLVNAYREAAAAAAGTVEKLCAVFGANAELNRRLPGLAEFLAGAPMEIQRHPELAGTLPERGSEVVAVFHAILDEGLARGELRPEVPREALANLMIAASYGLSWAHGALPAPEEHEAVLAAFQQLLRGQLLPRD